MPAKVRRKAGQGNDMAGSWDDVLIAAGAHVGLAGLKGVNEADVEIVAGRVRIREYGRHYPRSPHATSTTITPKATTTRT